MTPEEQEALVEAVAGAHRERGVRGEVLSHVGRGGREPRDGGRARPRGAVVDGARGARANSKRYRRVRRFTRRRFAR
jgi:hypothetical protein